MGGGYLQDRCVHGLWGETVRVITRMDEAGPGLHAAMCQGVLKKG